MVTIKDPCVNRRSAVSWPLACMGLLYNGLLMPRLKRCLYRMSTGSLQHRMNKTKKKKKKKKKKK
eukprot:NODE_25068_length_600_cov_21.317125.p3 GENE.NODE_25068_length_600_cov_21.317125~~NODE_25068_length_600_cov_21.317125.p3  ORF type:complete len:65 (+),score=21.26 NODE_25068_length_600_cov_21.317125:365-559(+)